MGLDRGRLAQIDRRLLAELDHGYGPQMVKVPLSDAAWSTWRRYCDVLGLTMGEGVAGLIDSELGAVVDISGVDRSYSALAIRADERLRARETQVAARERDVGTTDQRQRDWGERLRRWEDQLKVRELRVEQASKLAAHSRPTTSRIGRNDRCPCGSSLKYKHCHGVPGR